LTFVHLFEWKWTDIARECETFLGPKGFSAVQISPPSEHAVIGNRPWWERYQTVGYSLANSRSGTEAEFRDMVTRCAKSGVGIFVDAVINHMTGQASGVGSNGTKFTKYNYPGLYSDADFHAPKCEIAGSDYTKNASNVQRCELLSLSDLDTGATAVQTKIADYLLSLVKMGVRGFRIDAAKHMAPSDLDAILNRVNNALEPSQVPYYFLEVIDYGGEAIHARDYLEVGRDNGARVDVTEFKYSLGEHFLGKNARKLAELRTLSPETWQLLPSDRSVVFTNNHDTQRGTSIFYQDGAAYELANVFLLAAPYGHVSIMSSFAFDRTTDEGRAEGPPSDAPGKTRALYASPSSQSPACAASALTAQTGSWVCEHRQRSAANMVGFRNATEGAPLGSWWDNGANAIAFGRQGKGFVVINHESSELKHAFDTGLGAGVYCNVLAADFEQGACSGETVSVDAQGRMEAKLAPHAALAIHVAARLK
jgi:alpha-amylase